jgi:type II secretory pathway component GspD/PulD (secretin)
MNRCNLVRSVLAGVLACLALVTWAQQALEIIPLKHRTVDQVLPVLRPLLEPGATLSGSRGQLLLRASAANVAEIRRALDAIDRPSRQLQISVRLDDALERERRSVAASGTISNRGASVSLSAEEARRAAAERVDQRLQVLEGGHAFIFTGQSNDSRDLASGFEVTPRVSGHQVHLEIAQQRETPGARGSVQGQRLTTAVTTRLGEWVEIGGTASSAVADGARAMASRRVWVRVDEVPN